MTAAAIQSGVRLFEAEPDLLGAVPDEDRQRAARAAVVPAVRIPTGRWDPAELGSPRWGILVLDGLVAREVIVAGTAAAELLGVGDLISAPAGPSGAAAGEMVASEAAWTVLEPLQVALLDDRVHVLLRHWPELAGCLLERSERRAGRLAVAQAISHLTRVDTRVLLMLWTLAGRWGRVGPDGIVLPLRLTHRTLARLVGARRPSVTTAITELCRRELITRRDDGSWLLHGPPPEELERVGIDAILPQPAPGRRPAEPARHDRAVPAGADRVRSAHVTVEAVRAQRSEVAARLGATAAQIRALASAYETQSERTRAMSVRARDIRERSRRLRAQIAAERERSRAARPPSDA
ncbi:MAG TPA: helix-turn-helix domain-containing protein [Capillimicrobium sp.]|nr:helix-turn-helix domain-containing protein [Capillimicrobium sp.]